MGDFSGVCAIVSGGWALYLRCVGIRELWMYVSELWFFNATAEVYVSVAFMNY